MFLSDYFVNPVDGRVHDIFLSLREDGYIMLFRNISWLGDWQVIILASIVILLIWLHKGKQLYSVPFLLSIFSAGITTFILKILIARPRPIDGLILENDFSFPSGHATIAISFYGFLTYIAVQNADTKFEKNIGLLFGISIIILIGLSRLYLGVHYTSDVIAGYCVGLCGLWLGIKILNRISARK